MERNQFPQPEPESEELPLIEELSFQSLQENASPAEPEPSEAVPAEPEPSEAVPAEPEPSAEEPAFLSLDFVPAEEPVSPQEDNSSAEAEAFPSEYAPEPPESDLEDAASPETSIQDAHLDPEKTDSAGTQQMPPLTQEDSPLAFLADDGLETPEEEHTGESFMDRIPDVDEDYPTEEPFLPEPVEDAFPEQPEPQWDSLGQPEEPEVQEYADLPEAEAQAEEAQEERPRIDIQTTRKGRPKRKKGEGLFGLPNLLATVVWLTLIVVIGVTLGRMMWICAADVLAFGRPDQKVTITIYESDTMEDIIGKLQKNGLIRYKSLFQFYADISDAEEDIKPGIYDLNTRYDYHALVNAMSPSSTRSVVEVTIPEGYTCRQIFNLLEENRVCTAVDIASYAATGQLHDYWFLENVERGSEYCLEGFLFPDTYQFYKNSSPREALEKMLSNFDNRFTEEMRNQIETLNSQVTGGGYGVREVVIVASLIEKESSSASESPMIASVIYNRLHNWEYPALLNIDAAIIYAQGGESRSIDTGIDSPYNTYRYTGLTPTPIANPGLSSLQAALNPAESNYYYYVLNPATGKHQFSTTQEEHNSWIAKFYSTENAG